MNRFSHVSSKLLTQKKCGNTDISIVIPTFNKKDKLFRLLSSIVEQELDESITLKVVIVENSNACVEDIVRMIDNINLSSKFSILYYQNSENIGMIPNWNRCFKLANAKYALMVHVDDLMIPGSLKSVVQLMQLGVDYCIINRIYFFPSRQNIDDVLQGIENEKQSQLLYRLRFIDVYLGTTPVAPTGFLANVSRFLDDGGYKTDTNHWPEDFDFALRHSKDKKLYYSTFPVVIKEEGDGNDGSNKNSTIPWVRNMKVAMESYSIRFFIPFHKLVMYRRLQGTARDFGIEQYLLDLYPRWINKRIPNKIYNIIKTYTFKSMIIIKK